MANITNMTWEINEAMEKLEKLHDLLEEFDVGSELHMTDAGLILKAEMWYCGNGGPIEVTFAALECDEFELSHCVEIIPEIENWNIKKEKKEE